jgi:hypothetical protein
MEFPFFHHRHPAVPPRADPPKPVVEEKVMSTAPVTLAPKENKFESFLTKFGHDLESISNAAVNVAVEELPSIDPLLPPAVASTVNEVVGFAAQQVASIDAKYTAIGKSTAPFAVKVAEAVSVGGLGAIAIAAKGGLTLDTAQLAQFFSAAAQITAALNLTNVTAVPVAPVATA